MSQAPADAAPSERGRPEPGTKERILDAAERLFSSQGVAATSIRAITAEAGVNVAAVHYHYGGRDELLRAVLQRRLGGVNEERLRQLDALLARPEPPQVEDVVHAFLAPALISSVEDEALPRMADLLLAEPPSRARELALEIFGEVFERFSGALEALLPELPSALVRERLRFAIGSMIHAIHAPRDLLEPEAPTPPRVEVEEILSALTDFVSAGLRAPEGGTS